MVDSVSIGSLLVFLTGRFAMPTTLPLFAYAYGHAGRELGAADGPSALQQRFPSAQLAAPFRWADTIHFPVQHRQLHAMSDVVQHTTALAHHVATAVDHGQRFHVFGGDHTVALGTWSGAAASLPGPMGLLWIDAHLDAHTPETTESGHVHGMPLAALLGYGPPSMTQLHQPGTKLDPRHVVMVGPRDFESGEHELLKRLGVTIYYSDDVHRLGCDHVLRKAMSTLLERVQHVGVTLDLDALDPTEAPGVGNPVAGGLPAGALLDALRQHVGSCPQLIGTEIAEYNPHRDTPDGRTGELAMACLGALWGTSAITIQRDGLSLEASQAMTPMPCVA